MRQTMISARVPQYLINEITSLQDKTGISLSELIRTSLTRLLREQKYTALDDKWFNS